MIVSPSRARSFDAWADDYDRYRPDYPDELFSAIQRSLALPERPAVADLGAGTGRASLAMARRGWRVTAVEPGGPMLEALRRAAADARLDLPARQATAEDTRLPAASVDLATAAQAYHWFDRPRALAEMARIVRPGGGIALFWNVRDDEHSPFLADYTALLNRFVPGYEPGAREMRGRPSQTDAEIAQSGAFDRIEGPRHVRHAMRMDAPSFIGLSFTSSYVKAGLDPVAQEAFRDELVALVRRHHGDEAFDVPYQVDLWTARRMDR